MNDILYQISIFGNFTSITPDTNTIKKMMDKFEKYELVPSVVPEQKMVLSPIPELVKSSIYNKLQMVSNTRRLGVTYSGDRIDINKATLNINSGMSNEDFKEVLDVAQIAISDFVSTRVAYNTTSILVNPPENVIKKLQPSLEFCVMLDELTLNVNKRSDIRIRDNYYEKSNVILNIQKSLGKLALNNQSIDMKNGLIINFDINTLAENSNSRFSQEDTEKYITASEKKRKEILIELMK